MPDGTSPDISPFDRVVPKDNFTVLHNPELQYSQYIINSGQDKQKMGDEFIISDEIRERGFGVPFLRKVVQSELTRVQNDPFGSTSVDYDLTKGNILDARSRSVNRSSKDAEEKVGVPFVIKSARAPKSVDDAFLDRRRGYTEDLTGQYLYMRDLRKHMQEKFTPQQQEIFRVAEMYGVAKQEAEEFLFMELVDGQRMQATHPGTEILDKTGVSANYWFDVDEHRELVDAFPQLRENLYTNSQTGKSYFNAYGIKWTIADSLGIPGQGMDTAPRNILVHEIVDEHGNKHKRYIMIDQNPHDPHNEKFM